MVLEKPSKESILESLLGEQHGSRNNGKTRDAAGGHGVHGGAGTIGNQRVGAKRFARRRPDSREHGIVPRERGGNRFGAERIATDDGERWGRLQFLRRSDECRDLVSALLREVDDLFARSSGGAEHKQSHTSETG
jgi:hypothetical protein